MFLGAEEAGFVDLLAPLLVDPLHFLGETFVEAEGFDALGGELGGFAQGAFDGDLPVAEVAVVEDLGFKTFFRFLAGVGEVEVGAGDLRDVGGGEGAVFLAEVFAKLFVEVGGVDELDFAATGFGFVVAEDPDVGGDVGVVEDVVGQLDDGFEEVVLDEVLADVAGAAASIAGEESGAVVDGGDAAAGGCVLEALHLADHLHEEEELVVIDGGGGGDGLDVAGGVGELDFEAGVDDFRF